MINKKGTYKGHKGKALVELIILVLGIFAFAYIIGQVESREVSLIVEKKSIFLGILKLLVMIIFSDRGLVSAQIAPSDLNDGVHTCLKNKNGAICVEYPVSQCNANCASPCLPASRDKTNACKLGTCFDPVEGICSERSPLEECTKNGGKWFDDEKGNVPECQKRCCVIEETGKVKPLATRRECEKIGERGGVDTKFREDIINELACFALENPEEEGACVFDFEFKRTCKFITKKECNKNGGIHFPGFLCTHPDIKLNYKPAASTECINEKLYWVDSQGNRENIFEGIQASEKKRSWNNGIVKPASKSCELGNSRDSLANQKTCGNCNRFLGSVCGREDAIPESDFACKDLRCIDKDGKERENGESWCEYQGQIGIDEGSGKKNDEGNIRSVDTPGSRHFRATCVDGEVEINPCSDYRNSICVEKRTEREIDKKEISNSACITNLWQLCLNYNTEVKGKGAELKASTEKRNEECVKNPLCVLKKVDAADNFKFDLCVPKYPPGFDLQKNPEGSELSCAFANQKCTVISVKEIGGWKVKVNEGCLKQGFAEQMNDLCMSLGDCGASVNYEGDLTLNYKVKNSPKLKDKYINEIKKYSEVKKGQYAEAGNISAYYDAIGGIARLGKGLNDQTPDELAIGGTISGLTGTVLIMAAGTPIPAALGGAEGALGFLATPGWQAAGGVVAGAAIGFAVTALLIQYTGIGAGLDPAITWTLIAAGTVGGALLGAAFAGIGTAGASGLSAVFSLSLVPVIGWIILIVVIIVIVIFTALGIGKTKKVNVSFTCEPWQPPLGGDKCDKCGEDGYPCSSYSCQSLGANCRLLNEGQGEFEACADIGDGDVSAPRVIGPWNEVLANGYRYDEFSDRGMKISSKENDGCLKSWDRVFFGIRLNEHGQCRINSEHTNNYDEMENDKGDSLGGRNLFLLNHTHLLSVPDLTSLVPGFDPTRRADYNYYIRCIDGNGNGKDSAEFAVNFCVKPGEDHSAPAITGREPIKEEISFGKEELSGTVFTNEPADCRWDLDSKKKYDEMENEMECENDVIDMGLFGFGCSYLFNISKDDQTFYIKCKDQSWYGQNWNGEGAGLGEDSYIFPNESKRNEMDEAYPFVVKRTVNPLKIDSIKPNNETLIFGVQPASGVLEVKTSGGVDNGRATCFLFEEKPGNEMDETFLAIHKQPLNLYQGNYNFPIVCVDSVKNRVEGASNFDVKLDVLPPVITRIYGQDGNLIVITDEEAECAFVKSDDYDCDFDFGNGTLMSGSGQYHSASFDSDITHYIKCKDKYDISQGDCGAIVNGV